MAEIRERAGVKGISWSVRITKANTAPLTKTFKLKTEAQKWALKQERDLEEGYRISSKGCYSGPINTLKQLLDVYLK